MRPVIRVSLNGRALQLEDDAHALLAQYLESATRALDANPDRAEILADLEVAIVEKSARFLGPARDVLSREQIATVLDEIGPVEPVVNGALGDGGTAAAASGATASASAPARRLHQITDGAMIGGVCNGLAAWLGVDATVVRIVAVILAIATGGAAILAYLLLMLILPYTPQSGTTRGLPRATRNVVERIRGESAAFTASDDWQRFRADAREAWQRMQTHTRRQWQAWRPSRVASSASGGSPDGAASAAGAFTAPGVDRSRAASPSPMIVLALIALLIAVVALRQ